ncbi:MAG: acetoacetate--CoA ligase [Bradymonadia bacterium]
MSKPLWSPSAEHVAATQLTAFTAALEAEGHGPFEDYAALHRWSVAHPGLFWTAVWQRCGVVGEGPLTPAVVDLERFPGARWFPETRLNFAENLLRHTGPQEALVYRGEDGTRRALSRDALRQQVGALTAALKGMGVQPGDRVAGFMPNIPATVVAMLATASLGAVWTSCSPDFGISGVLDRFGQTTPKVLFCPDAYHYGGKVRPSLSKVVEILDGLPMVEHLVVVPHVEAEPSLDALTDVSAKVHHYPSLIAEEAPLSFERVPFDHPLYVMYSSGTTGVPKCIVHCVGGSLLQHLKEQQLHGDLRPEDTIFYYTTCGWMMWNWLVSGLATGARVLLFDGSPFQPAPTVLWDVADEEGMTIFGTSAKYIAALEKAGVKPRESHRLEGLRAVLSTGSPLTHESFDYVYRDIKADVLLGSISGGTDILSCFALCNPNLPVYRGQLQCPGLAMDVQVLDDEGSRVIDEKGELTCCTPFPSAPVGFWNDPDGARYHRAYFDRFEGIWAHGDYAEETPEGGLVIHGRSDAVLNPGGVRIGTAEIYRQVEKVEEVLESLAVGQRWGDDVRVVLFVVLREGVQISDDLQQTIRQTIRSNATPRHVPARIVQVPALPRTRSGKIVELAVRNVVHGDPVKNTDALANPEALEHFRDRPELQS